MDAKARSGIELLISPPKATRRFGRPRRTCRPDHAGIEGESISTHCRGHIDRRSTSVCRTMRPGRAGHDPWLLHSTSKQVCRLFYALSECKRADRLGPSERVMVIGRDIQPRFMMDDRGTASFLGTVAGVLI